MTSPAGPSNFEYSDDSVVARLSFDVPPQALTDVTQLTQALAAMATQQDYVARSSGTWLDYMNQVPQIMERANQAYRESITQMERMAYLQNEMGGGQANVGPSTGDPSGGAYSTAAGAGYQNPFAGMQFGMGVTPDLTSAQQHMQNMAMQSPQMYANFMGARGMAVNPALMGMMGGAVGGAVGQGGQGGTGGGQGWGAAPPGSMSPQGTQSSRDSAAPPNPTQGGASTRAEPTNIPAEPHEDSPDWVRTATQRMNDAQRYMSETGASGSGRASTALAMAGMGLGALGKYSASRSGEDGGGGVLGSIGSRLGGFGKAAGVAGLAAAGMGIVQRGGEQIQEYQNLGSVQGGDYQTGIGYEAQARFNALDPFVNTEQVRDMMQKALSAGFRGGDFDEMVDSMKDNYKEFGMAFAQTMNLDMMGQYGGESVLDSRSRNKDTLAMMSQLSDDGGASFNSRSAQLEDVMNQAVAQGASPESARRAALGYQEGYGDNMALRESIGKIGGQVNSSPLMLQMAAQKAGVGGDLLPGALAAGLSEAGMDQDEIMESAAGQVAEMVKSYPNRLNRVAAFQDLMGKQGVPLSWPEAEGLYEKVTGEQKPSEVANKKIAEKGEGRRNIDWNPFTYIGGVLAPTMNAKSLDDFKNLPGDTWDAIRGWENNDDTKQEAGNFAASGRAPKAPPSTPQQAQQVQTQGTVQGNVTITVDQNGRVTAPQQIQLSGQQKSANAGYGSAQLNNSPPGDPSFGHSYNGWGDK